MNKSSHLKHKKHSVNKNITASARGYRGGYFSKFIRAIKNSIKKLLRSILLSRQFKVLFKFSIGVVIFGSAVYGAYAFIGNTFLNDVIVSKSEIIARVTKHTQLPEGEPDAVVRVQDADVLKKQNEFYANVKDGDYIIMYHDIAIIYDLRNDTIVALKRPSR